MKREIFNYFKILIFCLLIIIQATPAELLASPSGGLGRIRQCDFQTGGIQGNDGLDFDPSTGGKDSQWVLTNPVCASLIAYSYAAVKTAICLMDNACGIPGCYRIAPSLIADTADIMRATYRSATGNAACLSGITAASTALSTFVGVLAVIYQQAKITYNHTKICGDGWYGPNTVQYNLYGEAFRGRVIDGYPANINTTEKIINLCRTQDQASRFSTNNGGRTCENELSFATKHYREYFYGGVEVEDNPYSGSYCEDPYLIVQDYNPFNSSSNSSSSTASNSTITTSSGTSYTTLTAGRRYAPQKYYLKGYEEGNYNCERYKIRSDRDPLTGTTITADRLSDFNSAYQCCIGRAANSVCIDYFGEKTFCKADSNCTLTHEAKFITFETKSRDNNSKICVQTYSLCPYNFYIGGGSAVCDYFKDNRFLTEDNVESGSCNTTSTSSDVRNSGCVMNNKAGKCKNYCQYMKHCVKVSPYYSHDFGDASPYMAEACINFEGDSRNTISYGGGSLVGSSRHFSAPIVQCFKETLENVFHNRAGHTRCITNAESGGIDISGVCTSGYAYRKGEQVYQVSLFQKFQQTLNVAIRVALSLVIAFYGMKILMASGEIKKKDLMLLIVKIAFVMYFATGNAWKDTFFDGIYSLSNFLSELVFKIQIPTEPSKLDGCQFGDVYTSIAAGNVTSTRVGDAYPNGKSYLAIWDTLDCKLARYLGFGPNASAATIGALMVAGWLIGPIGSYFVAVLFFFAMLLIILIFRAVHIFLASTIAILLLIFISPITITCILTEKTKGIFSSWLKQLLSFAFQPMILFIYLAIMVSSIDKALVGSARYSGTPPAKIINCSKYCAERNGAVADGVSIEDCDTDNRYVVKPKSDSFECLISSNTFAGWPGLELIGISIPFIIDLFTEDPKKKILTLVKGLIMVYFLYKFMDEVPNVASQLFGGSKLPQSTIRLSTVFGQVSGIIVGVQKRASRAGRKIISGTASSIGKQAERSARNKARVSNKESGSDSSNSGEEGGDDAKS